MNNELGILDVENQISYSDFEKVDVRCGRIIGVEDFPEAKIPAYKLTIDFGTKIGMRKSSVRIVENYSKEEITGMQVVCVINFLPKKVGPFISEVLTLGLPDSNGKVILVNPGKPVPNGARLF